MVGELTKGSEETGDGVCKGLWAEKMEHLAGERRMLLSRIMQRRHRGTMGNRDSNRSARNIVCTCKQRMCFSATCGFVIA